MKKLLFLVILLIFMGCSNTQIDKNKKNDIGLCVKYLNNWELEKLETKILEIDLYDKKLADELKKDLLVRKQNQKDLEKLLEKIKFSIEVQQIDDIEVYFENTLKNRELLKFLKENDFSSYNIVVGKAKFYKNTATNVIGLIYLDQVEYLSVKYRLKENNWRIEGWKAKEF